MPAFCDEDGYDSPHKDQLKVFGGRPLHMLTYPVYYHDKQKSGSLADSEPPLLQKIFKKTKSIRDVFSKWLPLRWATSILFGWQSSFKHQNNQQDLQFSKIIIIYIYLKIPKNEFALVLWEWVTYYSRNNMSSNSRAAGAVFIFESDPQKRTCSQWVHSMLSFTYMMNQNITSVANLYRGDISVTCHNSLPPDWDCLKWHHLSAPHLHSWRSSNTPKWSKQFLDG